jgi:hypothetical protein
MSRCLKDQTLLSLHDGEETGAERAHLAECEDCAGRYRQLGTDLEAITQTLRGSPPPLSVGHRARPFTVRWLPAAVAVGVALVLTWGGLRFWSPSDRAPLKGAADEEIWSAVEGLSADFFMLNQAFAEELLGETADLNNAAAGFDPEWPCEWYDVSFDGAGLPISACAESSGDSGARAPKPKA